MRKSPTSIPRFMKLSRKTFMVFFLFSVAISTGARTAGEISGGAQANYRLDEIYPSIKMSYYTSRILKFLDHWPAPILSLQDKALAQERVLAQVRKEIPTKKNDDTSVFLRAIRTPNHSQTVGMVKYFNIKVPLEKVVEVTERFEEYPKIWGDVLSVTVPLRDRNRIVTEWIRKSPAFFLSKVRYKMLYVIDRSVPDRVVYRQQLIEGNAMSASDGLVVLEKVGDGLTRASIVAFFEPNCDPFCSMVEGKIWQKSMEGSLRDDVAFRARLEHPDWKIDQITEAADQVLDRNPINQVEYTDSLHFD